MSRSNESWTWSNNSVWIWKMIVDEIGEVHKSSHLQMYFKIGVLENFTTFTGKYLCWSLFLRKLQACNFVQKRLQHRNFPVNIAKFLRTIFFIKLWNNILSPQIFTQRSLSFWIMLYTFINLRKCSVVQFLLSRIFC